MAVGDMPSAERVPREKQGTHTAAHDELGGRAESLRRGSVAPLAFSAPCCRNRSGVISKDHTAEENRAGRTWGAYMDLNAGVCRLGRLLVLRRADAVGVVVEAPAGLRGAG